MWGVHCLWAPLVHLSPNLCPLPREIKERPDILIIMAAWLEYQLRPRRRPFFFSFLLLPCLFLLSHQRCHQEKKNNKKPETLWKGWRLAEFASPSEIIFFVLSGTPRFSPCPSYWLSPDDWESWDAMLAIDNRYLSFWIYTVWSFCRAPFNFRTLDLIQTSSNLHPQVN